MTFRVLGLPEPLLRAVDGEGYADPTPIRSQAIPCILAARGLLGCAQNGTGKTAAIDQWPGGWWNGAAPRQAMYAAVFYQNS